MDAHPTYRVRRDSGIYGYERALARSGLAPVAGVDEAGRGACAGPLVVGAAILPQSQRGIVPGLADSKVLTPLRREQVYAQVIKRAVAWSVVVIPAKECDRLGMHVADIEGMRRALAQLETPPRYVLSDGFPVNGLTVPALAVPKGDAVIGCVAAASVIAKVTRDRLMGELHGRFPAYGFDVHKGYVTSGHQEMLERHGACPEHRRRFVNVLEAIRRQGVVSGHNGIVEDLEEPQELTDEMGEEVRT